MTNKIGSFVNTSKEKASIDSCNKKQWWTPVWARLVMDSDARHYKKMKNAIWLFLYLVLNADIKSGFLARKVRTIALDMGITRDTVLRWLGVLRRGGYISTQNTGRYLLIQIRGWENQSSGSGKCLPQERKTSNSSNRENPTTETAFEGSNLLGLSRKSTYPSVPIDTINKYILNNDIDGSNPRDLLLKASKQSKSTELAMDIASALGDHKNLALYISYSRRYPVWLLRKVLGEVKEIPAEKIKKSRGALFNYLVQKYAKETS